MDLKTAQISTAMARQAIRRSWALEDKLWAKIRNEPVAVREKALSAVKQRLLRSFSAIEKFWKKNTKDQHLSLQLRELRRFRKEQKQASSLYARIGLLRGYFESISKEMIQRFGDAATGCCVGTGVGITLPQFKTHAVDPSAASKGDLLSIYLASIGSSNPLSLDEEAELARRSIEEGDQGAREALIRQYLSLVIQIAKGYRGRGVSFNDLIQAGNVGLVRAVDHYFPQFGTKFGTMAGYRIKNQMIAAIEQRRREVSVPNYILPLVRAIERIRQQLMASIGRNPTPEEILKQLRTSFDGRKPSIFRADTPEILKFITNALAHWNKSASSLENQGSVADGLELEDFLADRGGRDQVTRHVDAKDAVLTGLQRMDERERDVLELRFGLGGEKPLTLDEVGKRRGLTRERIRQLEKEAKDDLAWQLRSTQ